jgi:hypothetical protein
MNETLITGINGQPQWVPCQIIEYGEWVKDREGNPWQKVRVFIPPFEGTHIVSSTKLREVKR